MWAATAWDDSDWGEYARARGWTVMGRLRERQEALHNHAIQARRRMAERATRRDLPQAALAGAERDRIRAEWHGSPIVIAFLFAHPDSSAMRMLDARGEYFDCRTGDTWDLFFPGYYRSSEEPGFEVRVGARAVGHDYAGNWFFHPRNFEMFCSEVEHMSGRRWGFSGGSDLVVVNGWLAEAGEPIVDWESTMSGQLTDIANGSRTLTIAEVIERITRDLRTGNEDSAYGVGEVTGGPPPARSTMARDIMVNALGGIGAALGAKAIGF